MASTYVRGYLHMCRLMATEEILEAPTIMESNNYGFTIAELMLIMPLFRV